MKHLLILGAGGMGKTVFSIATGSIGYGTEFDIKGFLDVPNEDWNSEVYPPILCHEDNYEICQDDVFVCSIGNVQLRKKICEKIQSRGGQFISLVHKKAELHHNTYIEDGTIIAPLAIIGNDVKLGKSCLVQSFAVIGHDAEVGNYTRLDCHTMIVGGVSIGESCTIHSSAVVNHKVKVRDNATVAACSFVVRNVKEGTTVYGNPAKKIEL